MDPTYPLFPIFAFLGFIIVLIPLPWHLQAWNSGTCAFMIWTAVQCFVAFVNCVVWAGSVENKAPIWCDISTQLMLGAGIGIPASILCISRRLYTITRVSTVSVTRQDKRRAVLVDLGIALGIPVLVLVFHTVVHAHRFNILEDIGCYPVTYNTLAAYPLYYVWPPLLGCISFVYSGLTLRSFYQRRAQFATLINSSHNTAMNMNRYLRLMSLAIIDMSCTVPMGVYVMYIGTDGIPLAPWISWEDTHFDFGRVVIIPALIWRNEKAFTITVELSRWLGPICAFLFFGLFGFASEAKKHYRLAFWWCAKRVGYKPKSSSSKFTLPSWNRTSNAKNSKATSPVSVDTISSPPLRRKGSSFSSPDEYAYDPYGATYSSEVARPYGIDTEIHPMSPTTFKVVTDWENAQVAERTEHLNAKRPRPPGSPSTSTLPLYKSEAGSTTHQSDRISTRSTVAPSTRSAAPSFVNDMGVDTARDSTCTEGRSRFSIDISDSRPASPSQFSDDFKPLPALPSSPEPPPYAALRLHSASSYSNTNATLLPPSSLHIPARTPLRHAASAPESLMGVRVTVDTIREIV